MRKILAISPLLAALLSSAQATEKWAIVTSQDLVDAPLSALLTLALLELPELDLVERDQIAVVTGELTLSTALGSEAAGQRLEWGRRLSADRMLFLVQEQLGNDAFIRAVFSDTATGARLWVEFLPYSEAKTEEVVREITVNLLRARAQFAGGVKRVIAVPDFVSKTLTHDHDHLQSQLANVLQSGLAAATGTAVLELEEARAIGRELDLRGERAAGAISPAFVEGTIRVEGAAAQSNLAYKLSLKVTDGSGVLQSLEHDSTDLAGMVVFLRDEAAPAILKLSQEESRHLLSIERQAEMLNRRAKTFRRLGEFVHAVSLFEASLLLNPQDTDQGVRAIRAYIDFVKPRAVPGSHTVDPREGLRLWRERLSGWRRALGILEQLIHARRITRTQVLDLNEDLSKVLRTLAFWFPNNNSGWRRPTEPRLLAEIDRELRRCTDVHRAFIVEAMPLVSKLNEGNLAGFDVPRRAFTPRGAPLFSRPLYERVRTDAWKLDGRDLDRIAGILENSIDLDTEIPVQTVIRLIVEGTSDSDRFWAFSHDELHAFFVRLRDSKGPMNQFYGRLGLIVFEHYLSPEQERTPVAVTTRRLSALRREMSVHFSEAFVRKRIAEIIDGLNPTHGASGRRPISIERQADNRVAAANDSAPVANEPQSRLRFGRLHFTVRFPDGRTMPLEDFEWADQPGYVSRQDWPIHSLRVDDQFDLFWNNWTVWLHREPGVLDRLLHDTEIRVQNVVWDGQQIWVSTRRDGILLFSRQGRRIGRITEAEGLPPSELGLALHALEPGRTMAAGSFGTPPRAWCAFVDWTDGSVAVQVFHEAAKMFEEISAIDRDARRKMEYDPQAGFVACCMREYRPGLGGGRRFILIHRVELENKPLVVDPTNGAVGVVKIPLERTVYLRNGDRMAFDAPSSHLRPGGKLIYRAQRGRLLSDGSRSKVLIDDEGPVARLVVRADGYVYISGRTWRRFDPETLEIEPLGAGPFSSVWPRTGRYIAMSAHFGILVWNKHGKFFRVVVDEPKQEPLVGTHRFQVVEAGTDKPLAGVRLGIETHERTYHRTSDDEGSCEVDFPEGRGKYASILLAKPGYVSREIILRGPTRDGDVDGVHVVRLQPTQTLGGSVQTASGQPLENARVRLSVYKRPPTRRRNWIYDYEAWTGKDGRWKTTIFPAPLETVEIEVTHAKQERANFPRVTLNASAIESLRAGEYSSRTGPRAVLAGRVVDEKRNPIADATIAFEVFGSRPDGRRRVSTAGRTRTDAQGRFEYDRAGLRRVTIRATAAGFAPHAETIQLSTATGELVLILERAVPLRGRVVDEQGGPLENVRLRVLEQGARRGSAAAVLWEALTDAQGRFTWKNAPAGGTSLRLEKPGFKPIDGKSLRPGDTEHTITLKRARTFSVRGRVIGKDTKRAIETFTVLTGLESRLMTPGRGFGQRAEEYTDGEYRVLFRDRLAEALRVDADGYLPRLVAIPPEAGDVGADIELNIELERGRGPHGVLLKPNGSPAVGATLFMVRTGENARFSNKRARSGPPVRVTSDDQGGFELPPQLVNFVVIAFGEEGFAWLPAEAFSSSDRFTLESWGRIEGRRAFEGLNAARSDATEEIRFRVWGRFKNDTPHVTFEYTTKLDDDGRFVLDRVPPIRGRLNRVITIKPPGGSGQVYLGRTHSKPITVQAGDATIMDILPVGYPVKGAIRPPEGSHAAISSFGARGSLKLLRAKDVRPDNLDRLSPAQRQALDAASSSVSPSPRRAASQPPTYAFGVADNGDFVLDDVEPGRYLLTVDALAGRRAGGKRHTTGAVVVVPPLAASDDRAALDIGELTLGAPKPGFLEAQSWVPRTSRRARSGILPAETNPPYTGRIAGLLGLVFLLIAFGWWRKSRVAAGRR
ncbi:MAG: carboxypeptidase regulatory-like domain-containing protein [Planctomycetes bacterium]|nr:carboxypeptidase regulatory-like domain-containing protein [Planctomycetota bacterium]